MSQLSDRIAESGWSAMADALGDSVTYTAGGTPTVFVAIFASLDDMVAEAGEFREDREQAGELQVLDTDVATVTPDEDTVTINGDVWAVMKEIDHVGSVRRLRIERTTVDSVGVH